MSQGTNNHPTLLSVDDTYFDPNSSHFGNGSFPQWPMQGSRTMASSIPSPTSSIQTSMTAPAPIQRASSHLGISNSGRSQQRQSRLSASANGALLVPPRQFVQPSMDSSTETFDRFYNDGPWSSERLRAPNMTAGRSPQPNSSFQMYRDDVASELDSIARSDSGYHTHYARSIISNEPEHINQELPPEMTLQVTNMNVHSAASSEPTEVFPLQSDQASQYSGRSGRTKEFKCSECGEKSKCKSDYKKHMLKHQKPFKCEIKNCRRKGKGFTTINDLSRHKKSVHGVGQYQNSYQCASENCRNKAKIWPRLDNFKQHIQRMHKDEEEQDLIHKSIFAPSEARTSTEIVMDPTLIAGIGTEKQFPDNDLDDPTAGISLTPEQGPGQWTIDVNPAEFTLDVNPHLPRLVIPGSGNDIMDSSKSQPRLGAHSISPRIETPQNPFQDPLNALHTRKASPSRSDLESRRRLSSAPQTKVEQQKQQAQQALHQYSRKMQNSSPSVPNELEDRVLQILCGATGAKVGEDKSSLNIPSASNESEVVTLTKDELLRASQTISNLIKQNRKALLMQSRRSSRSGASEPIICEICGTTLARSCDMKKHMKRHTRPYGCTYPRCHKRFGAKSDWKRHENSQHYQLETFRCQHASTSSPRTLCADIFLREQDFRKHLEKEHKIRVTKDDAQREIYDCRIGRNGQGQFWCGFCEKIVKLNKERNAAWDERFDHIDAHFNKEKRRIENWLCVDARKKKGEVLRELESSMAGQEESEGSGGGEGDEETPSPDASGAAGPAGGGVGMGGQSVHQDETTTTSASDLMASYEFSRKRRATGAPEGAGMSSRAQAKRARVSTLSRYCCSCNNGPWEYTTYVHCMLCDHELCDGCMVIDHVPTEGMGVV